MKDNQKGFSVIEIVIAVIIISVLGSVGWLVYNRQNSPKKSSTPETTQVQTETKSLSRCDTPYKEMKNDNIGISFCYPETWKVDLADTAKNHVIGTVTLTSPDYNEIEGSFGGSNSGSRIYVSVFKIDQLGAAYNATSKIIDGTAESKGDYSDIKVAKIGEKDGVSFIWAYEGPRHLTNQFEYNGNIYSITLYEDLDGPIFNDNLDAYQNLVTSFQLLHE